MPNIGPSGVIAGVVGVYGVYKIWSSISAKVRRYSPRTTHSKLGNPIHVIEDQDHYNWAIEELDREIRTADCPFLGFVCRWKQDLRTGQTIFAELQLARPEGICIIVDLITMGVPQKLLEMLSKSTVVGIEVLSGALFLEDCYNIVVKDYIDMSKFGFWQFAELWNIDVNASLLNNFEHGYTEHMIQTITSNTIGAVKWAEQKEKLLDSCKLYWPMDDICELSRNGTVYHVYVASNKYTCRYIIQRFCEQLPSAIDEWTFLYTKMGLKKWRYIGFDCRWTEVGEQRNPVALLQLVIPNGPCVLIRLCRLPQMKVPHELQSLLSDPKVLKVGINAMRNARLLEKDYNVCVRGVIDLHQFQIFSIGFEHYDYTHASDWEQEKLTSDQLRFASKYVITEIEIFEKLCEKHADYLEIFIDIEYDPSNILFHQILNATSESAENTSMQHDPDLILLNKIVKQTLQSTVNTESTKNDYQGNLKSRCPKEANNGKATHPLITNTEELKVCADVEFPCDAIQQQFDYHIHVVSDENICRRVVEKLLRTTINFTYLGFDCKWVQRGKQNNRVALLQLADPDGNCALFRLHDMGIPNELRSLLDDPEVFKVAINPMRVTKLLEVDYKVRVRGVLDIRNFQPSPPNGLVALAQQQLNVKLTKDETSWSNWERRILTDKQIQFAASDAIVALKIFESFFKKHLADILFKRMLEKISYKDFLAGLIKNPNFFVDYFESRSNK